MPLNKIENSPTFKNKKVRKNFYLKQGVCEGNPDVDAIYRIINKNINIKFKNEYKFSLGKAFSPINSQNTIWSKILFYIMYLPVTYYESYRYLERINRFKYYFKWQFISTFYGTTMKQNRNFHVLENDLKDELPLFESVENAFEILKNLKLKKGPQNYLVNLHKSYDYLIKNNIFDKKEMFYLNSWIRDINKLIT